MRRNTAGLASCPSTRPVPSLPVLARLPVGPDDLAIGPDGHVWVTATADGRVLELDRDGRPLQTFRDPDLPEGIVVTTGRIWLGDQAGNRVVSLEPSGARTRALALSNRMHGFGLDGLGLDAARGRLLIPDSPDGVLLTMPLGGGTPVTLATQLGRPVAAAVGADGFLYVAAENPTGLWRVSPGGGRPTRVGRLSDLDEVVSAGRLLYTAGAGDGTVRAVDPRTGADRVLANGGQQLQGLTVLPDGRLLIADTLGHALSILQPCREG